MADQTSPIQPIEAAINVATRLNENFDAASPAMLYGRDARTTTGLTWGYIGGRFGGALIASGTVTLTASSTNHVVAARADGVVTNLVASTNWDNVTGYIRLYKVTAGASSVTGYEDHRQAIGGTGGGGGTIVAADISDSTTVGRAVLTAADELAARTAIGAGTSNFSGAYADLSGKPTLGTASALNVSASGDAAAGEVVKGDDTRLTASLTNPMTDEGDLIVGGAAGAPTRLGISTNGYVLTLASGVPVWAAPSGGGVGSFTGGALTSALDEAKGADIARAATTNIGAATGNFVHLTGTTTVTGLGTVQAGTRRIVRFAGAGILTHNATSLILPGAANITTAANDCAIFVSEGSGNWRCVAYSKANGQAVAVAATSITGFTSALNTASPNNTTNVSSIIASGGTTNQDAVYGPKGAGALLAQIPDNTATRGNRRGGWAVDFQRVRGSANQVASADYSVIVAGSNNRVTADYSSIISGDSNTVTGPISGIFVGVACTVSGTYSVVCGGSYNTVSGDNSGVFAGGSNSAGANNAAVLAGNGNTASGPHSVVCGGYSNTASGQQSFIGAGISNTASGIGSFIAGGTDGTTRGHVGASAHASGQFGTQGDAQTETLVLRTSTNDATATALTADGGTYLPDRQVGLPDNSFYEFEVSISARQNTTGDGAAFKIIGAIKRGSGAGTVEIVGTPAITVLGATAGAAAWAVNAATDTSQGALAITVTGEASKSIKWVARVQTVEVVG